MTKPVYRVVKESRSEFVSGMPLESNRWVEQKVWYLLQRRSWFFFWAFQVRPGCDKLVRFSNYNSADLWISHRLADYRNQQCKLGDSRVVQKRFRSR